MMTGNGQKNQKNQQGNALFLILMAAVLFVALAYAVVQLSNGDKGSSTSRADRYVSNNNVTQYASAIRTGVTRMLLRNLPIDQIDFSIPLKDTTVPPAQAETMIFQPNGGGVTYAPVDADAVVALQSAPDAFTSTRNGNWYFVHMSIRGVASPAKELVAVLDDVKPEVCKDVNYQITSYQKIPVVPQDAAQILSGAIELGGKQIDKQNFLCIKTADHYLYYHVLAEQ